MSRRTGRSVRALVPGLVVALTCSVVVAVAPSAVAQDLGPTPPATTTSAAPDLEPSPPTEPSPPAEPAAPRPQRAALAAPGRVLLAGQTWRPRFTSESGATPVLSTRSRACRVVGPLVRLQRPGRCAVTASVAGADGLADVAVVRTVTVLARPARATATTATTTTTAPTPAAQTVTYSTPARPYVAETWTDVVRLSSGRTPTVDVGPTAVCTRSTATSGTVDVDLVGPGTCTVTTTEAGDATHAPVLATDPGATTTVVVARRPVGFAFSFSPASPVHGQQVSVTASATDDLTGSALHGTALGGQGSVRVAPVDDEAPADTTWPTTGLVRTGATVRVGNDTVTAALTPTDTTRYARATGSVVLSVARAPQVLALAVAAPTTGRAGQQWTPSITPGGSGEPVVLAASGACTVASGVVTYTTAGTCVVTADQAGSTTHVAADTLRTEVAVTPRPTALALGLAPADPRFGGALTVTATATDTTDPSGAVPVPGAGTGVLTVTAPDGTSRDVTLTYAEGVVTTSLAGLRTGRYTLVATYEAEDDGVHDDATTTGGTDVAPASQTITVPAPDPGDTRDVLVDDTGSVRPTASSGLPVTATVDDGAPCALTSATTAGGAAVTVRPTAAGACVVRLDQAGDADHEAAPRTSVTFTGRLRPVVATVTSAPAPARYAGSVAVTVTVTDAHRPGVGVASGIVVRLPGITPLSVTPSADRTSTTVVYDPPEAGTQAVEVQVDPDEAKYDAYTGSGSVVVVEADQVLTAGTVPDFYVSEPQVVPVTGTVGGGAVSLAVAPGSTDRCSVVGAATDRRVVFSSAGPCDLVATQAAVVRKYHAATLPLRVSAVRVPVTATVSTVPVSPRFTDRVSVVVSVRDARAGGGPVAAAIEATLPGVTPVSVTPSADRTSTTVVYDPPRAGTQDVVVRVRPSAAATYGTFDDTLSLAVARAPQTVTVGTVGQAYVSETQVVPLTGTPGGGALSLRVDADSVDRCSLVGPATDRTVRFDAEGDCHLTAVQAAVPDQYLEATTPLTVRAIRIPVSVSTVVTPAAPTYADRVRVVVSVRDLRRPSAPVPVASAITVTVAGVTPVSSVASADRSSRTVEFDPLRAGAQGFHVAVRPDLAVAYTTHDSDESVDVALAPQAVAVGTLPTYYVSEAQAVPVTGTPGGGVLTLAVDAGSADRCSVVGPASDLRVRFGSAGSCSLTATQAAVDGKYLAAQRTLTVSAVRIPLTASLVTAPTRPVYDQDTDVTVTVVDARDPASPVRVPATITVTLPDVVGATTSTPSTDRAATTVRYRPEWAGPQPVVVEVTALDPAYDDLRTTLGLTVAEAPQAVAVGTVPQAYVSEPQTLPVTGTPGGGAVTLAVDPGSSTRCRVDEGFEVAFLAAGACDLVATQAPVARRYLEASRSLTITVARIPVHVTLRLTTAPSVVGDDLKVDATARDTRNGRTVAGTGALTLSRQVTTTANGTTTTTWSPVTTSRADAWLGGGRSLLATIARAGSYQVSHDFTPNRVVYAVDAGSAPTTLTRSVDQAPSQFGFDPSTAPTRPLARTSWTPAVTRGPSSEAVRVTAGPAERCTVDGGTVRFARTGECRVVLSQAGDEDYRAATDVVVLVDVVRSTTRVVLSATDAVVGRPVTVTASGVGVDGVPQPGTLTFHLPGVAQPTVVPVTAAAIAAGTAFRADFTPTRRTLAPVTVDFAPDDTVVLADSTASLTVAPVAGQQVVRAVELPAEGFAQRTLRLEPTLEVGPAGVLPVVTEVTPDVCTVSGDSLRLLTAGTCTVAVSAAAAPATGAPDWLAARTIEQTLKVVANPVEVALVPPPVTFTSTPVTLRASVVGRLGATTDTTVPGTVTFSWRSDDAAGVGDTFGSVALAAGDADRSVELAVQLPDRGAYTVTASFTPDDAGTWRPAGTTTPLNIARRPDSIAVDDLGLPAVVAVGTRLRPQVVSAAGRPVSVSSLAPSYCTAEDGLVVVLRAGVPTTRTTPDAPPTSCELRFTTRSDDRDHEPAAQEASLTSVLTGTETTAVTASPTGDASRPVDLTATYRLQRAVVGAPDFDADLVFEAEPAGAATGASAAADDAAAVEVGRVAVRVGADGSSRTAAVRWVPTAAGSFRVTARLVASGSSTAAVTDSTASAVEVLLPRTPSTATLAVERKDADRVTLTATVGGRLGPTDGVMVFEVQAVTDGVLAPRETYRVAVGPQTPAGTSGIARVDVDLAGAATATIVATYAGDTDHLASDPVGYVRRPPTLTATVPGRGQWSRTAVEVGFDCVMANAALVGDCPAPRTFTRDGDDQGGTETIVAADGGTASVTYDGIRIDTVAPRISLSGVTSGSVSAFPGATPRCAASDALSGVTRAGCVSRCTLGCRVPSTFRTGADIARRYEASVTDVAGNTAAARLLTFTVATQGVVGVGRTGSAYAVRPGSTVRVFAVTTRGLASARRPRLVVYRNGRWDSGLDRRMAPGVVSGELLSWQRSITLPRSLSGYRLGVRYDGGSRVVPITLRAR